MQTILDGIMGSVLRKMLVRLVALCLELASIGILMGYLYAHIHIYWK